VLFVKIVKHYLNIENSSFFNRKLKGHFGNKFTFIFCKNKLRKYVIIRLHNLKLNTDIANIENSSFFNMSKKL
jgi:hypothetical protein